MEYKIHPHKLLFKFPFKLAHTTRDHTLGAYLEIQDGKLIGKGEIVFPPYHPETLESFKKFMSDVTLPPTVHNFEIKDYLYNLHSKVRENKFALAALDIALHNLLAQDKNSNIGEMYHITGKSKPTSFTIGMSTNEEMTEKIKSIEPFEYVKLKVDQNNIKRIVTQFQQLSDKPFVVDANQGFNSKKTALAWCIELKKLGVAYLEQPFQKNDLDSHKWLSEKSPIPIIADESFQTIDDMQQLKNCFSGINIKLMKCGGILPAYDCFQEAKKHKLLTVLGCMSESAMAVDAANHLSPLADWVDLDGPFLLKKIVPTFK